MEGNLEGLERLDKKYLINTLLELVRVPTHVPLGPDTLMEADHPKLVKYVQETIRPKLHDIGAYEILEAPKNQLVVKMGKGTSDQSLLMMVYTPSQHANLMKDPFKPKISVPQGSEYNEPCVFGQGVSQNKAHMAVCLTILKWLIEEDIDLKGTLYFGINNEGRSSHECTEKILATLPDRPAQALLAIGTDMKISIGNRGRVDVYVEVKGKATHSSDPESGLSAIDGAYRVMERINNLEINGNHPLLGKRQLKVYQIVYDPVAPHTLPEKAKLTLDRRLLPGEEIEEAVQEVKEALSNLGPYEISVRQGVYMLPSLTERDAKIVAGLRDAGREVLGRQIPTYYSTSTFDAGGLTSQGIPTVMFGASGGSEDILGDDYVAIRETEEEAEILSRLILDLLC